MSKNITEEKLIKIIENHIEFYKSVCKEANHIKTDYICWKSTSLLETILQYLNRKDIVEHLKDKNQVKDDIS